MADLHAVVSLDAVTVSYGARPALQDMTATFPPGAVGLLGPNGAGKSTLIKAVLGLLVPDRGQVRVLGVDVATAPLDVRARLGYMPEGDAHIPGMNAVSFVAYCGRLAGLRKVDAMQRAHEVLLYVGLGEARYRAIETYSTGMKQRVKLAQALVHDPDLLLLDEPTTGMDPQGRGDMLELVRDLSRQKGVNVILSSHLLPDVEYTCDQVVVLNKGRVAAAGPIATLKERRGHVYELRVKTLAGRHGVEAFLDRLRLAGLECRVDSGDLVHVLLAEDVGARPVFQVAASEGVQIRHLRRSAPTLDDAFARIVGEA